MLTCEVPWPLEGNYPIRRDRVGRGWCHVPHRAKEYASVAANQVCKLCWAWEYPLEVKASQESHVEEPVTVFV